MRPELPQASHGVIQRINEPWNHVNGVYGVASRLTFSQAIGTTGGTQTTNLDAKINGHFFGKFHNVRARMGGTTGANLLAHNYPTATCTQWPNGTVPHAEDYLLVALETEWQASGNWTTRYPYLGHAQQQSLLSLHMNRSPCPRCAKNLHRYCRLRGLSLRIKATFMHPDLDAKNRTGTSLLDSKNRPVRQWDTARILTLPGAPLAIGIGAWNARQLGRASNPYRVHNRATVETQHVALFNTQRPNIQVPLLTGWSGYGANLDRATIQNKMAPQLRSPQAPAGQAVMRKPGFGGAPPVYLPTVSARESLRTPSQVGQAKQQMSGSSLHWPPPF